MRTVSYAATKYGYCVRVKIGSSPIFEYTTGNSQHDSQAFIAPGSPGAVSRSQLRRWAKQTAEEMAEELLANRVEYDSDLEAQLEPCETVR
jgi:hypothetical protein